MKKLFSALKEGLTPPELLTHPLNDEYDKSVAGRKMQNYPFTDVPPRALFTDGYAELYVTPRSKQSRLMLEANNEVARLLVRRLERKDLDPTTAQDLTATLEKIEAINARLTGREPLNDREEIKRIRRTTPQNLGRVSLRDRIVEKIGISPRQRWIWQRTSGQHNPIEVHFTDFDARLVADNLEIGAKSLQRQARKSHIQSVLTARRAPEFVSTEQTDIDSDVGYTGKTTAVLDQIDARGYSGEALKLEDQANVLSTKAEAMHSLHDQLAMPPAPDINQPPQYIPLTS